MTDYVTSFFITSTTVLFYYFFNSLYRIVLGFYNADTRVLRHYHACSELRFFTEYYDNSIIVLNLDFIKEAYRFYLFAIHKFLLTIPEYDNYDTLRNSKLFARVSCD